MPDLEDRMYDVFVELTRASKGVPPSHKKLMQATGLKSTSHVHLILLRLVADGRLERYDRGGNQGFRVTEGAWVYPLTIQ